MEPAMQLELFVDSEVPFDPPFATPGRILKPYTCERCGDQRSSYEKRIYCYRCVEDPSRAKAKSAEGFYVYCWYDNGEVFYVGKGVSQRYLDRNHNGDAERRRAKAEQKGCFKAVIIENELDEDTAFWLEHVINTALKPDNNIAGTRSRKPPSLSNDPSTPL